MFPEWMTVKPIGCRVYKNLSILKYGFFFFLEIIRLKAYIMELAKVIYSHKILWMCNPKKKKKRGRRKRWYKIYPIILDLWYFAWIWSCILLWPCIRLVLDDHGKVLSVYIWAFLAALLWKVLLRLCWYFYINKIIAFNNVLYYMIK